MQTKFKLREVEQSIRDLAKIYKPAKSEVDQFVRRFVRRYNVTSGYENELKAIVLEELNAMKQSSDQYGIYGTPRVPSKELLYETERMFQN